MTDLGLPVDRIQCMIPIEIEDILNEILNDLEELEVTVKENIIGGPEIHIMQIIIK